MSCAVSGAAILKTFCTKHQNFIKQSQYYRRNVTICYVSDGVFCLLYGVLSLAFQVWSDHLCSWSYTWKRTLFELTVTPVSWNKINTCRRCLMWSLVDHEQSRISSRYTKEHLHFTVGRIKFTTRWNVFGVFRTSNSSRVDLWSPWWNTKAVLSRYALPSSRCR